jgi:hypothetical protein
MNNVLITAEQRIVLLANGRASLENPDFDPAPVVKLFTPDGGATWLLTEIDPDDHDHAFGLCDLGLGEPEIGWVSLNELASVRGGLGLPIERDLSFRGEKRLSAYRFRSPYYIVDRLFGAAELRLGGDKGDVVRIERTDGTRRN